MEESKKPILVTGGEGALASYAVGCMLLGRDDADVTQSDVIEKIVAMQPRAIVHLVAMTDHAACEKNPSEAYMVNAIGAYHVARAARSAGAQLCYVSTNAVFGGEGERPYVLSDTPEPRGVYGHSKYAGELLVRGVMPDALIVRGSWIFGGGQEKDKKFVGKIMQHIRENTSELKAVTDVMGTPTYGKDLMKAILTLLDEGRSGVIHITNTGSASRFDMAQCIVEALGVGPIVTPVPSTIFGTSIPKNEMLGGVSMRPWQEALREYIHTEWSS